MLRYKRAESGVEQLGHDHLLKLGKWGVVAVVAIGPRFSLAHHVCLIGIKSSTYIQILQGSTELAEQ